MIPVYAEADSYSKYNNGETLEIMKEFKTAYAPLEFVDAPEFLPEDESGVNLPVLQILEFFVSYVNALSFHACKITKFCSESAFSVKKSLKYHRFCEKIADFLVSFGIFSYLCPRLQIVVDHSAGRTSDAQL